MTLSTQIEGRCREEWTAEGLSEKTIRAYLLVIRRAEAAFADIGTSLLEATATDVRTISEAWPRTRSSRMQLRTALVRAWEACGREGAPGKAVKVPSKPRYRCKALAEAPAAVLARTASEHEGREGLAVMLGLYAALRCEEIAMLRWDHVRPDGWLRFIGKGDVTREIPVHPALVARLEAARAESTSEFVFEGRFGGHVSPTTVWTWSHRLGNVATHILRHTALATMNDRTGDLRATQEFAGHKSPETTVIYTRVNADRLLAAVGSLSYEEVRT